MSKVDSPKSAFEKDISILIKAVNELIDSIEGNERRFAGFITYANSIFKQQGITFPSSMLASVDNFTRTNHENIERVKKFATVLEKHTSACRLRETK